MDIPSLVAKAIDISADVETTADEESCPREMTMEDLAMLCPLKNLQSDDESENGESGSFVSDVSAGQSSPSKAPKQQTTAPRIKLDEQGRIIIDEKSLEVSEDAEVIDESKPLKKASKAGLNSCTFRKRPSKRARTWTTEETEKFFKVLCHVGADFQSMTQYFAGRSRVELKRKFLKEEQRNRRRIDHALSTPVPLDDELIDTVTSSEETEPKDCANERENTQVGESNNSPAEVAVKHDGIPERKAQWTSSMTSVECLVLRRLRRICS